MKNFDIQLKTQIYPSMAILDRELFHGTVRHLTKSESIPVWSSMFS